MRHSNFDYVRSIQRGQGQTQELISLRLRRRKSLVAATVAAARCSKIWHSLNFPDVHSEDKNIPSEAECRPYIEKALNTLNEEQPGEFECEMALCECD